MKKIFILTIAILFFSNCRNSLFAQSYFSSTIAGISEIVGTGTPVTLTASAASSTSSGTLPIGFTFNFYGNAYTDFYINPTGTISFGSANQTYFSAYYSPQNIIPSTNLPNNFIGFAFINPYDNAPSPNVYPDYSTATVNYFVSGASPNRILVINFKNVKIPATYAFPNQFLNAQIQLYESDGKIEVHNTNSAATQDNGGINRVKYLQIGIENIDGTSATAATCPQNWNLDNKTVRFTYCGNPVPTAITPNTGICNAVSQQTVNLSATCSLGTATWYKDDGSCVATAGTLLTSTSVSPTITTIYKVRCEGSTCNSGFVNTKITVTSSVPSVPSTITKNPTTPVNAGTSVTLSTTCSSGYYKWEDNSTSPTRIVIPSQTSTYSVKCLNGACESANVSATVSVIVIPPTISTPTTVGCSGTTATLTATNCASPDIVTWYQVGTGSLGTGVTKIVNLTTTSTLATNTYFASCKKNGVESNSSNVLYINVNGIPAAPTSLTKNPTTPINPNASVILTAVGCVSGNTIKWNDNSTTNPRTVTPAASTTYTAKCVNATCESATAASVTIDVNGPPVITATVNPICGGTSTILTASNCSGTLNWNNSLGSGTTKTITPTATTTYTVTCSSNGLSASLLVTVNPIPTLSAIASTPLNINTVGGSSTLSVTYSGGTLNWYENSDSQYLVGTGTSLGSANTITVSPTSEQNYAVICTLNGCSIRKNKRLSYGLTLSGAGEFDLDGVFNEGKGLLIDYVTIPNGVANVSYFSPSGADANTFSYTKLYESNAYNYQTSFTIRKNNIWETYSRSKDYYTPTGSETKRYYTKFQYSTQRPPCNTIWITEAGSIEKNLIYTGVCEVQPSCPVITVTAASVLVLGVANTLTVSGCNSPNTISWSDGGNYLGNTPTVTISPSARAIYTATCSGSTCATSSASISNNATLIFGGSYNLGCFRFNRIGPSTGNYSICGRAGDSGSNNYSNGQADSGTGFSLATFVGRTNNSWIIEQVVPAANYTTLYHTKLKYDTYNPPCTATWINDADGSEIVFNMSGACQNVDNPIASITLPTTICAGQSMPVNFTIPVLATSYTVELVRDWTNSYTGGGPAPSYGKDTITTITGNSTTISLPIPASFNYFGSVIPIPNSGCVTTSLGGGVNKIRCDNYRVRVTPIGSIIPVSQSILQLNELPTANSLLSSTQSGDWNTATTWQCGATPTATNTVQVQSGHIIDINTDVHAKSVKLLGTGKLNYTGTTGKLILNQ